MTTMPVTHTRRTTAQPTAMRLAAALGVSIFLLGGCQQESVQTPGVDTPARPQATYDHPARTAGAMESVDPEAYPQTPGFTDAERPPVFEP